MKSAAFIPIRIALSKLQIEFYLCVLCVLCGSSFLAAQGLPLAPPAQMGMSAEKLKLIDATVEKAIADKKMPGAVVIVGRKGKIVYRKAFGNRALVPTVEKMTVDTIFDAASLTKPIATATSIMILVERGQLRLNDRIEQFIPELKGKDSGKVTIQQLLTHTSGYQPDFDLREKWTGNEGMLKALEKEPLRNPPGTKFVYSDIGFIVLGEIVSRLSGNYVVENAKKAQIKEFNLENSLKSRANNEELGIFAVNNIFKNLNLQTTRFYQPGMHWLTRSGGFKLPNVAFQIRAATHNNIAPTENLKNQQSYLGGQFEDGEKQAGYILKGYAHDPTAFRMNGVAGHAGLFTTADDLARYCQMILNGGELDGVRVLSAATVARMTKPYVVAEDGATRGLGWDMNTSFSGNRGEIFPLGSFGHTGFTGTGVWLDRVSGTFVVFMSNRVHPDGKGDVSPVRNKISTIVASAIEDVPVEMIRLAENIYSSQVAIDLERFNVERNRGLFQDLPLTRGPQQLNTIKQSAVVLNGIDVLEKENFKSLNGLRVGLVTNHTGRNLAGKPTIDILFGQPTFKLVALFSPEHAISGQLDVEKIKLPVYSLYGETRRPKPEQLKDLDALVFDIQDIGARFYTYSATLLNVMEEAAKVGKPIFVLDRTNPINGVDVEGAIADADKLSFIAAHTLPVRHGLTFGELAQMFNAERKLNCDLRVVKLENWTRAMWFDQTNQLWTNPSPNMRSLTEAALYPGVGLLEFTNLSVGRGTDTPFEIIGAPWLDAQKLAEYLNNRNVAGIKFVPRRFTPTASVFKGEECAGVNLIVTDRAAFKPVRAGIEIAVALRKLFPNEWKFERYANLLVNKQTFDRIARAEAPEEIEKSYQSDLDEFRRRRAQFLLY